MQVVYIAGPYRSNDGPNGVFKNIVAARDVAIEYWRRGYAVICPHTNTFLMDGSAPDETWLEGDKELLRRSDVVVMLPDWVKSCGAREEHELAKALGMDIRYFESGKR